MSQKKNSKDSSPSFFDELVESSTLLREMEKSDSLLYKVESNSELQNLLWEPRYGTMKVIMLFLNFKEILGSFALVNKSFYECYEENFKFVRFTKKEIDEIFYWDVKVMEKFISRLFIDCKYFSPTNKELCRILGDENYYPQIRLPKVAMKTLEDQKKRKLINLQQYHFDVLKLSASNGFTDIFKLTFDEMKKKEKKDFEEMKSHRYFGCVCCRSSYDYYTLLCQKIMNRICIANNLEILKYAISGWTNIFASQRDIFNYVIEYNLMDENEEVNVCSRYLIMNHRRSFNNYEEIFVLSIYYGHKEIVEMFLNDEEIPMNPSANHNEALKCCVEQGRLEILKLLLSSDRVNPNGDEFIIIKSAAENSQRRIIKYLLEENDRLNNVANHVAKDILRISALEGNFTIFNALIEINELRKSFNLKEAIVKAIQNNELEFLEYLTKRFNYVFNEEHLKIENCDGEIRKFIMRKIKKI